MRSAIEPSSTAARNCCWRQLLLQAEGDLGSRGRTEDVPGFGLAVGEPHRLCIGIVWMDLDGKWLAREQQLEQERWTWSRPSGPLIPDFTDGDAIAARIAPGGQIDDAPRPWKGLHMCTFDCHDAPPVVHG
jgi:hypothetical protein